MKRLWTSILAATALFVCAPLAAQEVAFGFLDGQEGGGNVASGVLTLTGWALATSGVDQVVIQVDGVDVGNANLGFRRPTVASLFPGFPDSEEAGFGYNLNTTDFLNGLHVVSAKLITNAGNTTIVDGIAQFQFTNNTHVLVPFGEISTPQPAAQLFGTCGDPLNPNRRYAVIEGFALDLGVEIGDTGVSWVELLIDGSIVANTRTSCTFNPDAGGLTDCYGLPRPDIEKRFPFAFDAPNAGFRFALDIGALVDFGFVRGHHVLTIRSGDITNQFANIDEIPVVFLCTGDEGNEGSFGFIETPRAGRIFDGEIVFQGWALDIDGVKNVKIRVDGELVGEAEYGVAARPGVQSQFPGFPDSAAPVWRFTFDSTTISDGFHQVQVRVNDEAGGAGSNTLIGESEFFVDNDPFD